MLFRFIELNRIAMILEEQCRKGRQTFVLSLDMEKAFDQLKALLATLNSINDSYFLLNRIAKDFQQ